jgi:hypothetical protein
MFELTPPPEHPHLELRLAYILRYALLTVRFCPCTNAIVQVECANELFNAARLCPGKHLFSDIYDC